jgi:hypothetical protein
MQKSQLMKRKELISKRLNILSIELHKELFESKTMQKFKNMQAIAQNTQEKDDNINYDIGPSLYPNRQPTKSHLKYLQIYSNQS